MRRAIISLALVVGLEAVQGFVPGAVGLRPASALPSGCAISGLRGGANPVTQVQMASAHDFKLPLVGQ